MVVQDGLTMGPALPPAACAAAPAKRTLPKFARGSVLQVLGRLDYFVVGSNPGKGDTRLVLGLR